MNPIPILILNTKIHSINMWFRRTLGRLILRSKKPKFREIRWQDDGEVRPVTRGKAKQFGGIEEATSPTTATMWKSAPPYRIMSNLSYSSQAPLNTKEGQFFEYEKAAQGRSRYFASFSKM